MNIKSIGKHALPYAAFQALLLCTTSLAAAPAAPLLVGATDGGKAITLALTLPSRDTQGAKAFAEHVATPGDAPYRYSYR